MSLNASISVITLAVTVSATVVAGRVTLPAPLAINVLPNGLSPRTTQGVDLLSEMAGMSGSATMVVRGRHAPCDGYEGLFDLLQGDFTAAVAADPAQAVFVPLPDVPVSQAVRKRRIADLLHLKWFDGDATGATDSTTALNRAGDLARFLKVGVWGGNGESYLFGAGGVCWNLTKVNVIDVSATIRRSGTVATYDRGTDDDGNAIRFWTIHTPSTAMVLIGDMAGGSGRPFIRIGCTEAATFYDAIDNRTYRLSGAAASVPPTVKVAGLKNFDLEPVMIDHLWLYGDGTRDKVADSNSYFDITGGAAFEITINGVNGVQAVPTGGRNNGWNTRGRIYSRVIRASIGVDATGVQSGYRQNDIVINGDFEGTSAFVKFGNCANIEIIGRFEAAPDGCIAFGPPQGVYHGADNATYRMAAQPDSTTPVTVDTSWDPAKHGGQTYEFPSGRTLAEGDWWFDTDDLIRPDGRWYVFHNGQFRDNSDESLSFRAGAMNNKVRVFYSATVAAHGAHNTDIHKRLVGSDLGAGGNTVVHMGTELEARTVAARFDAADVVQSSSVVSAVSMGWRGATIARSALGVTFATAFQTVIEGEWLPAKRGMVFVFDSDADDAWYKPSMFVRYPDGTIPSDSDFQAIVGGDGVSGGLDMHYVGGTTGIATPSSTIKGLYACLYNGADDSVQLKPAIRCGSAPTVVVRRAIILVSGLPLQSWAQEPVTAKPYVPALTAAPVSPGRLGAIVHDGTQLRMSGFYAERTPNETVTAGTGTQVVHFDQPLTGHKLGDLVSLQLNDGTWWHTPVTNTPGSNFVTFARPPVSVGNDRNSGPGKKLLIGRWL